MLTVNGMDPTIHLYHMKVVVTDDIVVEMGGEAANGQESDEMEMHCEEEEKAVLALVLNFI